MLIKLFNKSLRLSLQRQLFIVKYALVSYTRTLVTLILSLPCKHLGSPCQIKRFGLEIRTRIFPQFFPTFVDLHKFCSFCIFLCIVFIKTLTYMLTSAVIRAAIHLERLGITILFFALRPDMPQFPPP